jgi:hypothetical protein
MSMLTSDRRDKLLCEKAQGKTPYPLSSTSADEVLGDDQAVQAADKSKKTVDQKRGADKNAKTSKRHKKLPPPPSECSTCGIKNPDMVGPCFYPGCGISLCFKKGHHGGCDQLIGCVNKCELGPEDPAKGDCPTYMCASHLVCIRGTFICRHCIDRGLEIIEGYQC